MTRSEALDQVKELIQQIAYEGAMTTEQVIEQLREDTELPLYVAHEMAEAWTQGFRTAESNARVVLYDDPYRTLSNESDKEVWQAGVNDALEVATAEVDNDALDQNPYEN